MTDLDRVTDLFEKWAAEENEHRQVGEYGLAEGLRVAIEDLRAAVHGGRAETTTEAEAGARALEDAWHDLRVIEATGGHIMDPAAWLRERAARLRADRIEATP